MGMFAGRRILGLRLQTQEVLDLMVSILDLIACFLHIWKAQGKEVSRRGEVRLPKNQRITRHGKKKVLALHSIRKPETYRHPPQFPKEVSYPNYASINNIYVFIRQGVV